MFRLLLLLGAGLYGALLIAGDDGGQLRAGLRPAPADAAAPRPLPAPDAAAPHLVEAPVAAVAVLPAPVTVLPAPVAAAPATRTLSLPDMPLASLTQAVAAVPANTNLRWVTADRANVRAAPSRNSSVAGRVERGEALLVLWVEPNGWARVRVEGDGVDGFVHQSLLTDLEPGQ